MIKPFYTILSDIKGAKDVVITPNITKKENDEPNNNLVSKVVKRKHKTHNGFHLFHKKDSTTDYFHFWIKNEELVRHKIRKILNYGNHFMIPFESFKLKEQLDNTIVTEHLHMCDTKYIVYNMKRIRGLTLYDKYINPTEFKTMIRIIFVKIMILHENKIYHCDLKEDNIMIYISLIFIHQNIINK
jgi:serine/threonine protein kinase